MRVRLWIRQDGEAPKAIARDATRAPGSGRLVDVAAPSPAEARRLYELAQALEPDEQKDGERWLAWRAARRAVTAVPVDPADPVAALRAKAEAAWDVVDALKEDLRRATERATAASNALEAMHTEEVTRGPE